VRDDIVNNMLYAGAFQVGLIRFSDTWREADTMARAMENGAKQDDGGGPRPRRARRSFTDEYKAGAVRLVLDEGKTVGQVARDLDLTTTALAEWVKRARADRTHGKTGLTTEERAELAKLRKEVRELRIGG
jgi:transposase